MKTNTSYVYLLVASYFSGKKCHNIKYLKYKCIYTNTNIFIYFSSTSQSLIVKDIWGLKLLC